MTFMTDLPEWAKDAVYVNSEHHFSFSDRLRILFGWTPCYDCGVATEELPGRTDVFSTRLTFRRPEWWPFKPKLLGYVETKPEEQQGGGQ